MKIVVPNSTVSVFDNPCFFLAGPVAGARDWHSDFCVEIEKQLPGLDPIVFIPKSLSFLDNKLRSCSASSDFNFDSQLYWETHHLDLCSSGVQARGCVIFWLEEESKKYPRDDGNPYAMETRREIGEFIGMTKTNRNLRFVVGAQAGFPGLITINSRLSSHLIDFKCYRAVREIVSAAISKINISAP